MTVHYLSFSAEINTSTSEGLIATMTTLCNQGATEINLLLSTPGGSVMNGIAVYNTLRALPIQIITHNMGNVDSIGNVVFLAGAKRYACPNATFMFHGVGIDVKTQIRLEEKILRERLDAIAADHKRIGDIIGKHSSLKTGDVVDLFSEARTKDAAWAKSVGLVDAVSEPQIPKGVKIHSLVFKR